MNARYTPGIRPRLHVVASPEPRTAAADLMMAANEWGEVTRLPTDDELATIYPPVYDAVPRKADRLPRLAPVDTPRKSSVPPRRVTRSRDMMIMQALVIVLGVIVFLLGGALVVSQAMMWAGWW